MEKGMSFQQIELEKNGYSHCENKINIDPSLTPYTKFNWNESSQVPQVHMKLCQTQFLDLWPKRVGSIALAHPSAFIHLVATYCNLHVHDQVGFVNSLSSFSQSSWNGQIALRVSCKETTNWSKDQ